MPVTAYDLHQMALKRIEELEQQRDALLAACKAQEDYDRYLAQCLDEMLWIAEEICGLRRKSNDPN